MNRILVVDDSLSVRKALEKILTPHAEVSVATNAEDALAQLHGGLLPELVITDVLMPGMSGFELARELRLLPQTARTPVILISGIIDDEVRSQAHEVGGFAVVRKPFSAEELLPIIRQAFGEAPVVSTVPTEAELPYDPALISEPRRIDPAAPSLDTPPEAVPPVLAVPLTISAETPAPLSDTQAPTESPRPAPGSVSASAASAQALVDTLIQKPGVLGALICTRKGATEQQAGTLTLEAADLAMYARFFASTADTLGTRLQGGATAGIQLEFEGRTLLVLPYGENNLLICLLTDANSSSMVKFALRRQSVPGLKA